VNLTATYINISFHGLDGNKRCGFMEAALFIEVDGFRFAASEEAVVINTVTLAAGVIFGDDRSVCRKFRRNLVCFLLQTSNFPSASRGCAAEKVCFPD